MNILMLGVGDAGLDDPRSEPVRRHLEYARRAGGRIDLVVDAPSGGVSDHGGLVVHRTGSGRLGYPSAALRLAREAAGRRMPDLIAAQDPFLTALAGWRLRRALRRPLLIQNHSSILFNPLWLSERPLFHRALHLTARMLLPRADAWRVVNTAERRMYVERLGLPAGKVKVIPVPCDLESSSSRLLTAAVERMRGRLRLPPDAPIILWAGRPVRFKRLPVLYAAFAKVRASFPAARLVIAGRRALAQEDLARREAELGIADLTVWVEDLAHAELAGLYGAAAVFLFPSRYEGFGRVLVEAGAAGLPAVATATAGATDIVREGVTGYLTPVEDAGALADRAGRLLADPGLRARMGADAREWVRAQFDPRRLLDDVVDQWRETAAAGVR
jgi:glycosyltransferase involved in cell wall biosynthesis